MINDLSTDILAYKYVDDANLYTITNDPSDGNSKWVSIQSLHGLVRIT